ncbi:unnamed protein product [Equus caballus papillomavirus 3]|uniref:Regulatory protein E2 n=1 Tax=Equus caballus papillomavirus 3 TaxID=940834 RepID=E7C0H3_9PAPI|nr:unnamed protein product [Equus caballus papillomavirus 3]ADV03084.1 putative E2 early protein [Equus caballus papillomavirus 3]
MEALQTRFDAVQEGLMMHYETGSDNLQAQIDYWCLTRAEQVMLYAARSKGRRKLGHTVVPSLAAAQAAAKAAIEMQLLCEKLANSPYAREPWTMTDTSKETYRAPPEGCFKKGPCLVQVEFDGEPGNEMWYTTWESIYYLDEHDNWIKTHGRVDSEGLYYCQGPLKVYYENFAAEAEKYSKTNVWKVMFQNQTFSSVTCRASTKDTTESAGPSVSGRDEPDCAAAIPSVLPTSATPVSAEQQPLPKELLPGGSPRYCRGSGRGSPHWGVGSPAHVPSPGTLCQGGAGQLPSPPSLSPSLSRSTISPATSPSSVPSVLSSSGCGSPCRPIEGVKSSEGVPAVLLKGKPNQLKCLRFRLKKTYWVHFWFITTTWFWAGPTGSDRAGRARMLVVFKSSVQRQRFLQKVPLPPGVERSEVFMADL